MSNETKEKQVNFKVGDKVSFGGMLGTVTSTRPYDLRYTIRVDFTGLEIAYFTEDGKMFVNQTEPVLKLVERPKRKVTKTV